MRSKSLTLLAITIILFPIILTQVPTADARVKTANHFPDF